MISYADVLKRKGNCLQESEDGPVNDLKILEEWAEVQDLKGSKSGSLLYLLRRPIKWGLSGRYFDSLCICGVDIHHFDGTVRRFYLDAKDVTLDNVKARNILASKVIQSGWLDK